MLRLSSDWTLFLRFFFPTVWIVFFGVVSVVILFSFRLSFPFVLGIIAFYLLGVLLLAATLLRLKRVEATDEHLYVTNYFRTFRYAFDSIARISVMDFIILKVVVLHFRERTSFGRKVAFIRRKGVWEEFLLNRDEWIDLVPKG